MPDGKWNCHFFHASTPCHFVWCISWPIWRISHFVHFPLIPRFSLLMQHVAYQWEWSLIDSWVRTRRIFGMLAFRPLNIRDWSHYVLLTQIPKMPPKSLLWAYFQLNRTHYWTDKYHLNAWCNACVSTYICQHSQLDTISLLSGLPGANHTEDELKVKGE